MRIRVREGRSLTAPDGRIIGAGQIVELDEREAAFAIGMGAADAVRDAEEGGRQPAKRAKGE